MLGIGCPILFWHYLGLPYNYFVSFFGYKLSIRASFVENLSRNVFVFFAPTSLFRCLMPLFRIIYGDETGNIAQPAGVHYSRGVSGLKAVSEQLAKMLITLEPHGIF